MLEKSYSDLFYLLFNVEQFIVHSISNQPSINS